MWWLLCPAHEPRSAGGPAGRLPRAISFCYDEARAPLSLLPSHCLTIDKRAEKEHKARKKNTEKEQQQEAAGAQASGGACVCA
jgi:hypothetical protein